MDFGTKMVDYKNVTFLNHPTPLYSKGLSGIDQEITMKENKWINNNLQSTATNLGWQWRDVIKALDEKYNEYELKRSNMNFEPYIPLK